MTVANLFAKHRAGEVSKEKFLYEVRRDVQLPYISNLTSYDDAIKILKQKGVIKEAEEMDETEIDTKNKFDVTLANGEKYHNVTFTGPDSFETEDGKSMLHQSIKSSKKIATLKHIDGAKEIDEIDSPEIKVGDTYEYAMSPGDTLTVDSISGDDMKVTTLQKGKKYNGEETKSWVEMALRLGLLKLKEGISPKNAINEQEDLHLAIDRLNPILVNKAINSELAKLPEINAAVYQKTLEKVVKKLQKDPRAYDDVLIANAKKINKSDEKEKMVPVKKEMKDATHQMKSPKGVEKKPKANTKAPKTENKKGKPKGVKEMPSKAKGHKGMEQMKHPDKKEKVLESLLSFVFKKKLNEDTHHRYGPGQGVETPDGHGTIKDIVGSTVTVEFDGGNQKDYQLNLLNHFQDEAKKTVDEPKTPEVKKHEPTMDEKKDAVIKKVMELLKKKKIKKEVVTAKTTDSAHNQDVYNKINKIPGQARTDIKKAYDSGKPIDI